MRYDKRDKLRYTVSAKKTFPVTVDGLLNFKIKGGCDVDKDFKEVVTCTHFPSFYSIQLKIIVINR